MLYPSTMRNGGFASFFFFPDDIFPEEVLPDEAPDEEPPEDRPELFLSKYTLLVRFPSTSLEWEASLSMRSTSSVPME